MSGKMVNVCTVLYYNGEEELENLTKIPQTMVISKKIGRM